KNRLGYIETNCRDRLLGAVKAPTIRRSHTCPWHFRAGGGAVHSTPVRFAILSEAAAVPHRHRSLRRFVASLVARAQSAGAYGAPDARGLREALRQAAEERCCRRRGYLRGGHQGKHAVRRDQDTRAAELPDAPWEAPSLHQPKASGAI